MSVNPSYRALAPSLTTITVKGGDEKNIEKAFGSLKFRKWFENFDHSSMMITHIEIRDVFMFGPNLGFLCMNNAVFALKGAEKGKQLSGYVFMRGGAVAILVVVVCKGIKYCLLAKQYRTAGGKIAIELIAGMMDESGNPLGVALNELHEEAGIRLTSDDLIEGPRFHPSIGGSDEEIISFNTKPIEITEETLTSIQQKTFGVEGEIIRIVARPIETFMDVMSIVNECGDAKLNTALWQYVQSNFDVTPKVLA